MEKEILRIKLSEEDCDYVCFLCFEDGDFDKLIKIFCYIFVFVGGISFLFIFDSFLLFFYV